MTMMMKLIKLVEMQLRNRLLHHLDLMIRITVHLPMLHSMMTMLGATLLVTQTLMPCWIQELTFQQLELHKEDLEHVPRDSLTMKLKGTLTKTQRSQECMEGMALRPFNRLENTGGVLATKIQFMLPPLLIRTTNHSNVLQRRMKAVSVLVPCGLVSLPDPILRPRSRHSTR